MTTVQPHHVDLAAAYLLRRPAPTGHPTDPAVFAREVLGADPWSTQDAILAALAVPNASVAVKGCHGSGKTYIAAAAVLWWVYALDGIALTTAPTGDQVRTQLWAEIHRAHAAAKRPLPGTPAQTELRRSPDVFAVGRSTDQGVRFQGYHGDRVLVVVDEAPGVGADIDEAIEGIRASGDVRVLKLGNPTVASGGFHAAFTAQRAAWRGFTVDAFDTPNLAGFPLDDLRTVPPGADDDPRLAVSPRPYLVTRRWVWGRYHAWGEASPLWQSRVRGQFPTQSEDALLSLAWLEAAGAVPPPTDAEPVAGVDVAGPGEDETVLAVRDGDGLRPLEAWSYPDPRGDVLAALRRHGCRRANVDATGIGYYLARHLADAGIDVTDVNVGEAPDDREQFANLKAQLYWGLRLRFEAGDVRGLTDDVAVSQLAGIRYRHNARGQVEIESKEAARKRGVKSPDRAEAIMLAFAERPVVYAGVF